MSKEGSAPVSGTPTPLRERLERGLPPLDADRSRKGEVKTVQWMHRDGRITIWESVDGRGWRGWVEGDVT